MKGFALLTDYRQNLRRFDRDVRLYLISTALNGFTVDGIATVLFNIYLLRLGYGPEFIGLVNAVGAFVMAFSSLPAVTVGQRWGTRRALIAGVGAMTIGYGAYSLAHFLPTEWQMAWILGTVVLSHLGLTLYYVNGTPFLMAATGPSERSLAVSLQVALAPLAGFAGSLAGGVLPSVIAVMVDTSANDSAPYGYALLLASVLLIPGLLVLRSTREVTPEEEKGESTQGGRMPYRLIIMLTIVVVLRMAGRVAARTFFNVYLDDDLHVSTVLIGALSAAGLLVSVPVALATPMLVARWGNRRVIAWGSLGIALSLLPLALIPHPGAAGIGYMGVTVLFSLTTGPFRLFGLELVSPRWRLAMSGAMMMGVGLSITAMTLGGGYAIAALGYRALFLGAAGVSVVGALLFWAYFRVPRGEFRKRSVPGTVS